MGMDEVIFTMRRTEDGACSWEWGLESMMRSARGQGMRGEYGVVVWRWGCEEEVMKMLVSEKSARYICLCSPAGQHTNTCKSGQRQQLCPQHRRCVTAACARAKHAPVNAKRTFSSPLS